MEGKATATVAPPSVPSPAGGEPDEALVARARGGDFEAFEALVARHQERIYRLAARMLRNDSDAQEVVQEALLSAWRNLRRFEDKAQFGSWLYRIAANAALMLLRTRRRHPESPLDEAGMETGGVEIEPGFAPALDWSRRPDEELQSAELRAHLQAAVDALPEAARVVFVLRDIEELSTEETAQLLDLSVPAVKTRLHRARLALRAAIGDYFSGR